MDAPDLRALGLDHFALATACTFCREPTSAVLTLPNDEVVGTCQKCAMRLLWTPEGRHAVRSGAWGE